MYYDYYYEYFILVVLLVLNHVIDKRLIISLL